MFITNLILLNLLLCSLVGISNAGGSGTILIKTGGKRRKGDLIIIEGGGKTYEKEEVSYKYQYIPVPMYMPKKRPVVVKYAPPIAPVKSMPMPVKAIEAQVIEAMVAKGGQQMMAAPIQAQVIEAMTLQAQKGGFAMSKAMPSIPMKGGGVGGGPQWWRRK